MAKTLTELGEGGKKAESAYGVTHQFPDIPIEIMLINNSNSGTTFSWKASLSNSPRGCRIDALFTNFYVSSCAVAIIPFITVIIFVCLSFPYSFIWQLDCNTLKAKI